jgi:hypothetical protein
MAIAPALGRMGGVRTSLVTAMRGRAGGVECNDNRRQSELGRSGPQDAVGHNYLAFESFAIGGDGTMIAPEDFMGALHRQPDDIKSSSSSRRCDRRCSCQG